MNQTSPRRSVQIHRWTRNALALIIVLSTGLSHAVEIRHWERLPLPVSLLVGQERVIFIDRNVRVGVSAALAERLRVQSAGGAIYLKANAPIDISRLQLQDADSGALILLDVTATTAKDGQPPLEPMRIVEDSGAASSVGDNGRSDPTVIESTEAPSNMKPNRATPLPVVLTRYAAQNLYAPLRTVEPVAGVASANLQIGMPLDTLMPSVPLRAAAMAAWRLDDFWVTAVKITNATSSWMALDPRTIQGDFVAATFQHPDVGPQGTPFDTTIVYLVTRGHGLAESLLPHISRIDAAKDLPGTDKHGVDMGDHHEE